MPVREHNPEPSNPLGMNGIEFIEFATSQPQALGAALQTMGFMPVARHRSREVTLYRQGSMNVIVNAHGDVLPGMSAPGAKPALSAIAFRVRDADYAWRRSLELGAWEVPTRASAMELNIPGIRGVGDSLIYFVDRYRDFSIYDVDFVALPGTNERPEAIANLHFFGVVQSIYDDRTADWIDFYTQLLGFSELPGGQYFGILPKGTLLEAPCHTFYMQLLEPPPGAEDVDWEERLLRIGLGAPDVPAAVRALRERGVVFVDRDPIQPSDKGALTQVYLGSVMFDSFEAISRRRATLKVGIAMNIDQFGMDTITLAGPLEAKLRAVRDAGFGQIMLQARDIAGHPDGEDSAMAAVRNSGLRVTGFQVLRDFEGLSGHLHAYKLDIARAMLSMCRALGSKVLLVCSTTSTHATDDREAQVRDLQKLSMLAVPFGIDIAYEALSWGRHVNEMPQAWDLVMRAERSNLGIALDSYHMLATKTPLEALDDVDPDKILFVQLSDFMWQEVRSPDERMNTARHFRVFPGEGAHGDEIAALVRRIDALGYRGDYSFEVFNDDYVQLPLATVAARARNSVKWTIGQVPRRSLPVRSKSHAGQD